MMKSCFMPPSISYSLFYIGWMKAYILNFPGRNSHVFIRVLPPRIKYRITRHGESGRWICESMENCLVGTFVIYSGGWLTYLTHLLPPNLFSLLPWVFGWMRARDLQQEHLETCSHILPWKWPTVLPGGYIRMISLLW